MKNYWIGAFKNANSHQQNEFSCGIRSSQSADGEMNPQRSWNKTRKRADSPTEAISKRLSIFTTPMKAENQDLPDQSDSLGKALAHHHRLGYYKIKPPSIWATRRKDQTPFFCALRLHVGSSGFDPLPNCPKKQCNPNQTPFFFTRPRSSSRDPVLLHADPVLLHETPFFFTRPRSSSRRPRSSSRTIRASPD